MMVKSWRQIARPVIAQVILENHGADEKTIRKALREAYPWGERKYHPYRIWCSEVNVQLGKKKFGKKNSVQPKEQGNLFK